MKKVALFLFFGGLIFGCTKTPEPEPAEQVIGTYTVNKLGESIKYATSPTEQAYSLVLPYKGTNGDELSATLDIAKKSSNIIAAVYVETYKSGATGKSQTTRDALEDIELKKVDGSPAGQFDMLAAGIKVGTIGNNGFLYENSSTEKDSLGKSYTYKFTINATKK